MAMNIKNDKVERLAEELAHMTGEAKTAAILRALEKRKDRIALGASGKPRLAQALDLIEREICPTSPEIFWDAALPKESAGDSQIWKKWSVMHVASPNRYRCPPAVHIAGQGCSV